MRKISLAFLLVASAFSYSSAHAANTYINLTGVAEPKYGIGLPSAQVPFVATIQYDTSLLNFIRDGGEDSYLVGTPHSYPGFPATPNSDIGSITISTSFGSESTSLYGIRVQFSSYGGVPASIFGPGRPPEYSYSASFLSNSYEFYLSSSVSSTIPFIATSPSWLPTPTDPNLTFVNGTQLPLQAHLGFPWYSESYYSLYVESFSISSEVSPVPEPSSLALVMTGLGFIGFIGRRKSKQAA